MMKDSGQHLFVYEKKFETFHLTTTTLCGNMKDEDKRNFFCRQHSIDSQKIVFADQIHGTVVAKVSSLNCGSFIESCDGLITNDKNVILCIFTADCMPVFMASRDYSVVAMIHAGWRGLAGGILENALICFKNDFGIMARDVFSYIGPHIGQCCYEVGKEVKDIFNSSEKNKNLSLAKESAVQLKELGIARIYVSRRCTCHETDFFYSYRREPSQDRMMSLISAKKDNSKKM
ncbi:MAG: peptidoglycan editing factor PgeF [Endomicrobiaceae bacterium]